MRLEEAIQQKSFKSEHQKLVVNIMYTHFALKEKLSARLSGFGITLQQYNVLRILKGQFPNGITTSDIRGRMLDKMSDASRLVDRLEKLKLVNKKTNPNDRRLVIVKLTDEGLKLLDQIALDQGSIDEYSSKLTNEEAAQLNLLLDKFRD